MFRFAVLLCLVLVAKASQEDNCCSHDDREAVLVAWETLWNPEFSHRRETVGVEIFKR